MPAVKRMPTPADLARDLHAADPTLTRRQIADRVSAETGKRVTPERVQSALRARGSRPGRPSEGAAVVLRERDLDPRVLELARKEAAEDGCSLAEVLAAACAASLVPEGEWLDATSTIPAESRRARSRQP